MLTSRAGPQKVLRITTTPRVDGHFPAFESPEATLTLVCHFRETASNGGWAVLTRAANRCGAERPLGSALAAPGEPVSIPGGWSDKDVVYARIEAPTLLRDRLRGLLHRPSIPELALDQMAVPVPRRLHQQPLILRVPKTVGFIEYPPGPAVEFVTSHSADPIRLRFYAVPIRSRS